MNKKIYILFALTAGLFISVHASDNVNTPENRQFLKQQENLSRQLREKPDHQLKAWAEKQVLETPLQRSDNHFLDELVRKQQASQDGKPRQGALYFVSFSIPEEGLKRMLGETRHYGIPATLRGMVNNDLKATADAVLSLVKDGATDGVQIDPTLFSQYGIRSVSGPGGVLQPGARHHPGKSARQAGAGESGHRRRLPAGGSGTAGRHRG